MKRGLAFLILVIAAGLSSCKDDSQIQIEATEAANQEFEKLDLSRIDQYPLFEDCDELQKGPDCFYSHLYELLSSKLQQDKFAWQLEARDSIVAVFSVGVDGQIRYDSIAQCAAGIDKHKMDALLSSKLNELPKIKSALKKDIPVRSSYLLPIIFQPTSEDAPADRATGSF